MKKLPFVKERLIKLRIINNNDATLLDIPSKSRLELEFN